MPGPGRWYRRRAEFGTALEAERAFFICRQAGRILTQREIEVLFRTTSSKARSILTTMRATYAEALSEQFAARIREDVEVAGSGTEFTELTWDLTFSEPATFTLALEELRARGLRAAIVNENASRRRIVLKRRVQVDGSEVDPLDLMNWHPESNNGTG